MNSDDPKIITSTKLTCEACGALHEAQMVVPGSESSAQPCPVTSQERPTILYLTIYKYLSKLLSTTAKEPSFGCREEPTQAWWGVATWDPTVAWLGVTSPQLQTAAHCS